MLMQSHVHVIDSDLRRRARVSRELMLMDMHAEIYEDIDEFGARPPKSGVILAADDSGEYGPNDLIDLHDSDGNRLPVAMYSDAPSPEKIVKAMIDGVLDYLQWPFDPILLDRAVERLQVEGERRAEQDRRQSEAKALVAELSPREREVLVSIVQGRANKETAIELGISSRTVEIHRGNMMRKLRARSTSDAVRLALYAGLDQPAAPTPQATVA
jgi:FixJ family two-component response regulator